MTLGRNVGVCPKSTKLYPTQDRIKPNTSRSENSNSNLENSAEALAILLTTTLANQIAIKKVKKTFDDVQFTKTNKNQVSFDYLRKQKYQKRVIGEIGFLSEKTTKNNALEIDTEALLFEEVSSEHQELVVKMFREITLNVINYYQNKHHIDLGKIDLCTGFKFCYEPRNTTAGSTWQSGKISNNIFNFPKQDLETILNPKEGEGVREIFKNKLTHTIAHEIHHKLLNIDNRYDLQGFNYGSLFIPTNLKEGWVEYLSYRFIALNYRNIPIEEIGNSEKYELYINSVFDNLDLLANKYSEQMLQQGHKYSYELSFDIVNNLFVNFFLAGDNQIIKLAKKLKVPSILD